MLGFNVSVSGIRVGTRRLDTTAHNVANATTPAFKSSRVDSVNLAGGGATVGAVRVNFNPGPLELDEGRFSLAINGDGFFRVQTPQRQRFTRAGTFGVDAGGNLVTPEGYAILPNIQVPTDSRSFSIGTTGIVSATMPDGEIVGVGQVVLSRFANPGGLSQEGNNLSTPTAASGNPIDGNPGAGAMGGLVFGAVEGSNVELASETVSRIVSKAIVKANLATLRTQDEVLGTVIDLTR